MMIQFYTQSMKEYFNTLFGTEGQVLLKYITINVTHANMDRY